MTATSSRGARGSSERAPRGRGRLVGFDPATFPFSEAVTLRGTATATAVRFARDALQDRGFRVDVRHESRRIGNASADPVSPDRIAVVGERNLATDPTDPSTLSTFGIVLVGGAVLGTLDSLVTSSWTVLPVWIAGFAGFGGILWLVFGRAFRSDVVVAELSGNSPSAGAGDSVVEVRWHAARVRSEYRGAPEAGTRRATRVQEGYGVVGGLAEVIRSFRARARSPESAGRSAGSLASLPSKTS